MGLSPIWGQALRFPRIFMRALRVVLAMESYLARLGARVTIVQGVVFVVCMLTFRRGVIGAISRFLKKPL